MRDEVDDLVEAWGRERGDLDLAPVEVFSRGAFEALLTAEADLLADLPDRQRTQLAGLLRTLLAPFS